MRSEPKVARTRRRPAAGPVRQATGSPGRPSALLVVSSLAAAVTLLLPGLVSGPAAMNGSARGTALVVLAAAVPTLAPAIAARMGHVGSSRRVAGRGRVPGLQRRLVPARLQPAFLLYVAMLGLSVWTLGGLLAGTERQTYRRSPQAGRTVAGYLVLMVAMTASAWLQ